MEKSPQFAGELPQCHVSEAIASQPLGMAAPDGPRYTKDVPRYTYIYIYVLCKGTIKKVKIGKGSCGVYIYMYAHVHIDMYM